MKNDVYIHKLMPHAISVKLEMINNNRITQDLLLEDLVDEIQALDFLPPNFGNAINQVDLINIYNRTTTIPYT